jgi:hypothetical protein
MLKSTILALAIFATAVVACSSDSSNSNDAAVIGTGGHAAGGTTATGGTAATGGNTPTGGSTATGGDAGTPDDLVTVDGGTADAAMPSSGPTAEGHLAIINAATGSDVVAVDVSGTTPPTYDPATATCK